MNGLPRWVVLPATLGALLVVLPVASLLTRVDVGSLWPLLTAPGARDALWLSLRTSVVATVLCVALGVPLALLLARASFPGRRVVRALLLLPLVLPPVVGGLALLTLLGRSGLLGGVLEVLGMRVPFTTAAVVVAQAFVALPFLVLTLDGALRSHDTAHEDVAATLGARPTRILLRVTLPALAPALISGTVLAFARALGEFGATITFAGALQGVTQTLPLEIYLQRSSDPDAAVALSLVLVVVALAIIVAAYGPWFPQIPEQGAPGSAAAGGPTPAAGRPSSSVGAEPEGWPSEAAPSAGWPGGRPGGPPGGGGAVGGGAVGTTGGGRARPPTPLRIHVRVPERGVDVSVDVPAGEVVAVLGPNGAGKSTLLQAVAGLGGHRGDVTVTIGDRVLAGPGVPAAPPRDRRVGWLGQRALLLRHLSVADNVAFGPVSRGMPRAAARALARSLLSDVGAAHLAGRRPHELSGGQAQRVAIARALATDPDVLLVDEPFSALDVGAAQRARLLLQAAHRAAPRTTLLVTHDLLDVAQLADRVIVLEEGHVVEDGPAGEVLTRPRSAFGGRFAGVNLLAGRVTVTAAGGGQERAAEAAGGSSAVLATVLGDVHGTTEDVLDTDTEAVALFEPRAVSVHRDPPGGSPRNAFPVLLTGIEPHGPLLRMWATTGRGHRGGHGGEDVGAAHPDAPAAPEQIAADLTPAAVAELGAVPGEQLWFVVKAAEVTVLLR
ncbi:molybdate transport system permease protein [Promicromonospora umidemergens]|uniref:Molybdate transport system permease protein n=1 Tax=Promicromonospora umidemergens TaxID=629679 RepID=A0ABP8WVE9_9MICO|nr:ABC transporter permease [Promicromonospora umidemergens]MCP2283754.1 molybdate transport system permease protein [Promicromonospora umidemergens]